MTNASSSADAESILTDEVRSWIGRTTELMSLPEEISASDVRRYVEATGDFNPLWMDDEAARAAGYRARVVPPMMVIDLSWRLKRAESGRLWQKIPLPSAYKDTRNADTEIEWLEPVYIGDRLGLRYRIADIQAKQGRRGLGVYILRETEYYRQDGGLVARARQTVVRFPTAKVGAD